MPVDDLQRDARRLRWAVLGACGLLLGVLALVAARSLPRAYRDHQRAYYAMTGSSGLPVEMRQVLSPAGGVDRCTSCHLGMERADLDDDAARGETPPLFRPHPEATRAHLGRGAGCTVCHGGTGRALEAGVAHAMPGGTGRDPLMGPPHVQASCGRCHVPGAQPGQQHLVRGALLYLSLGCATCHPLTPGGRGGWDYGPDLRTIGRKSLAYLEASLLDPTANFPRSTMPSFERSFRGHRKALQDLLVYLQGLVLEPVGAPHGHQRRSQQLVEAACTACHTGAGGRAEGRFTHRCVYLLERADRLRCAACHQEEIPAPGRFGGRCPVVVEHRGSCAVCHPRSR